MTATKEKVVTYAVLIEAREMRAAFGFTLADAVDEVRNNGAWDNKPHDCQITVRYVDGREIFIDTDPLSRPTVSTEDMRHRLIAIAKENLPKLAIPCPPGMGGAKDAWERWIAEGPTEHDIRSQQAMSAEWLPREDIESYERDHIPQ